MADERLSFRDRDEFLDGLFDHLFEGQDDVSDEDRDWFDKRVASFFAKLEGERPPGRRRSGRGQPSAPARRPGTDKGRRQSGGSGYGLSLFYGGREDAG